MFTVSKSISRRFFAALMLVAVLPILSLGYGAYKAAEDVVVNFAFMHMETIAQDHAHHIEIWFAERLGDIQMISQLPFVQDLCRAHCALGIGAAPSPEDSAPVDSILALARARSLSYQNVYIFSPSGALLASADPHSEEVCHREREALAEAVEGAGGAVLGPVHTHTDQKLYVHLAVPVRDPEGRIVALTIAVLDVSATLDPILTDRAGLGKSGETYIVSRSGHIITQSRHLSKAETLEKPFQSFGIREAIAGKRDTSIYRNYMGREVVGSYLWLPRYDWGLVAEMERDEILAPLQHIRTVVIITALLVGILSVLLALFTSRRVSRPITSVAQAAREMAEGRFDQRIAFKGSDEVGMLSESFNSMAGKLSDMIEALRQKEASLQTAYDDLLQTQENLVQVEKMAAVGELVTSVVHEMRNPLSSVKLNLQIIGRTIVKGSSDSEHYRIAFDQIMQLERMFTDLLNYSKPVTLDRTTARIEGLIEESLNQLVPLLAERGVVVEKRLDGVVSKVIVDRDKVRQVLVNVIKNAVEATGPGGRVEIAAASAETNGKTGTTITIADSGNGISSQDLVRIFQPFYTTKKKGTGLGLSIVKKIMEAHGSTVHVSSEEGRGTIVKLHFQGVHDEEDPDH